ncbi:hypothetical protein LEP1GSC163_3152 [Leptospira santarosai str. CBC379]|uniref:Uncharacterized protein n=1 Tax=Leptospira santarosai str. MOR084 TaxID=1049984 RepID=A0A0E2BBP0_9LEPT|nr:hypothetical protein LEP1GSC179_3094 [Leptospira santarosai str. MOR084]EKR90152.1 hypothetical protein LEP1GSC163_3152 [Leptospira santarosai str. CBC379]
MKNGVEIIFLDESEISILKNLGIDRQDTDFSSQDILEKTIGDRSYIQKILKK